MHVAANELPRIPIPRTSVNKGKREGPGLRCPARLTPLMRAATWARSDQIRPRASETPPLARYNTLRPYPPTAKFPGRTCAIVHTTRDTARSNNRIAVRYLGRHVRTTEAVSSSSTITISAGLCAGAVAEQDPVNWTWLSTHATGAASATAVIVGHAGAAIR
jgi:hypothetical protein